MQDLNAITGLKLDAPSVVQLAPVVDVAPANPAVSVAQNIPVFQNPTVIAAETDTTSINATLASIEGLLSNTVGRNIQVMTLVTANPASSSPLLIQHSQTLTESSNHVRTSHRSGSG